MGSPISGIIAEIYLQHLEEIYMKHWIESRHIMYYKRYVDDIVILFDHKKTNELEITRNMNGVSKHLEFKTTMEDNNSINYLDLTIYRNTNSIEIGIY